MNAAVAERPASRAPRLPAEERRRQILDAAISVFGRQGYAAAGTAGIAAAAGIGEPTIYRYYANKRELHLAALKHAAGEIKDNWERIAAEEPDPLNALLRIGQWYHQELRDHPEYLQLRFRSMTETADPEVVQFTRDAYVELARFVETIIVRAKEQGRFGAAADTRAITWLFMAIGAVLDVTELLGLQDELGPRELAGLGRTVLVGGLQP